MRTLKTEGEFPGYNVIQQPRAHYNIDVGIGSLSANVPMTAAEAGVAPSLTLNRCKFGVFRDEVLTIKLLRAILPDNLEQPIAPNQPWNPFPSYSLCMTLSY